MGITEKLLPCFLAIAAAEAGLLAYYNLKDYI